MQYVTCVSFDIVIGCTLTTTLIDEQQLHLRQRGNKDSFNQTNLTNTLLFFCQAWRGLIIKPRQSETTKSSTLYFMSS